MSKSESAEPSERESLIRGAESFERWLERSGPSSFDPYDVWGTSYGVVARRLYYKQPLLGLPLIAPVLALEILCPGLRGRFVKKERFATADGQLVGLADGRPRRISCVETHGLASAWLLGFQSDRCRGGRETLTGANRPVDVQIVTRVHATRAFFPRDAFGAR